MQEKLEKDLALRIQLFRETGQVRAEVADFVEDELKELARAGLPVSEETAGMLTSHLMMALNRLMNGESLDDPAAGEHMAAELADRPEAVHLARQIVARAGHSLGTAAVPASETGYLAMHLAVLTARAARNPAPAARGSKRDTASAERNGGRS